MKKIHFELWLKRDKKIHSKRIKRDVFDPIEKGFFKTAIEKRFKRYILDSNWEKLKDTIWTPIQKIMTLFVAMPCECSISIMQ